MTNSARIGTFAIPISMMQQHPEDVRAIMGRCLITHCEYNEYTDSYDYTAHCDEFEETSVWLFSSLTMPRYKPIITGGEITWQKV